MQAVLGQFGQKLFSVALRASALTAAAIVSFAGSSALAHDVTDTTVSRTAANNATLELAFSKQLYKTIYVDEQYTIQVPYQTTETYWDSEPYTTQRYVCHTYDAHVDLRVAQPTSSRFEGSVGDAKEAAAGGFPRGGGVQGGPPGAGGGWQPGGGGGGFHPGDGGGWHPGGGPGGPPEHVPQQHCGYESTTEYRQVQRTRTVTAYRTETRCCQSVPHSVPDHVWAQAVELIFPVEAALNASETEKIEVTLAGSESTPSVKVDSRHAIFKYSIVRQDVSNGVLNVQLAIVPTLTDKDLGVKTIGSVTLDFQAAELDVRIQDASTNPRVLSSYDVRILEKGTTVVLGETMAVVREGLIVRAPISGQFDPEKDYIVQITVARSGVVVVAPVQFSVVKTILAEKIDAKKLASKVMVGHFSTVGRQDALVLRFRDDAGSYKTVRTDYAFTISLKDKKVLTPVAAGSVNNQALKMDKDGHLLVPLKDTFKVDPAVLALLVKHKTLTVQLVVTRSSKRIGQITITQLSDVSID
jgi:hypothetical protein